MLVRVVLYRLLTAPGEGASSRNLEQIFVCHSHIKISLLVQCGGVFGHVDHPKSPDGVEEGRSLFRILANMIVIAVVDFVISVQRVNLSHGLEGLC